MNEVRAGLYLQIATLLRKLADTYQAHHRPPDFELPGIVRVWVIPEGTQPPASEPCNISPITSPDKFELAWIWDGPRREVSSG